ncbi:hypothetical protein [Deinococcus sp. ME38]|uniref:hypothetical protein n=1 Tax=Deinococcus sp. ME38 TaxID=3400344 RepID=UPI003B5B24C8
MTDSDLQPYIRELISDIQSGQVKSAALVKMLSHALPAVVEAASLKLMQHPDWSIRKFVAKNRSGPMHILELLTLDPDEMVRSEARATLRLVGAAVPEAPSATVAASSAVAAVSRDAEPEKPTSLAEAVEQFVDRFRPYLDLSTAHLRFR